MILTMDSDVFHKAIKLFSSVSKKSDGPEGKVLIERIDDVSIRIVANNGSVSLPRNVSGVVAIDFDKVVFSYNDLYSFALSLPCWDGKNGVKEFTIKDLNNDYLIFTEMFYLNGKSSKSKLKLKAYDINLVKVFSTVNAISFNLNCSVVNKAIRKVLYAVDPNDTRQFIQGVCLKFYKNKLSLAGTNGMLLSEFEIRLDQDIEDSTYIIKYDFLYTLSKLLNNTSNDVVIITIDDKSISAIMKDMCLSGKRVVGYTYPEYKNELNKYEHVVSIYKEVIFNGVAPFLSILDKDDHNRVSIRFSKNGVSIYSDTSLFEFNDDIPFDGDLTIDVNGLSLLHTISAIDDPVLLIKFSSSSDGNLIFDSSTSENQKSLITYIKRR